jgi:hypothetical protein
MRKLAFLLPLLTMVFLLPVQAQLPGHTPKPAAPQPSARMAGLVEKKYPSLFVGDQRQWIEKTLLPVRHHARER